ncbi:MAG: ABC transporter permease [Planctomycetota bacterium]
MRGRGAGGLGPRTLALGSAAGLLLLYLPLLAVAALSLNSARVGLRWEGLSLVWYQRLFADEAVRAAAWNTLLLALASTALATPLGTLLALGLERTPWSRRAAHALDVLGDLPVVTPDIVFAAVLVIAFNALRQLSSAFAPGLFVMVLGHVTFQVAFVSLVVRARLALIGQDLAEAANDLYADRWFQLRHVTLPLLLPGVVVGALLAFTLSLDDFVISFFTAGPRSATLPIHIYASLRRGLSPELHALSTLIVLVTLLLVSGLGLSSPRTGSSS